MQTQPVERWTPERRRALTRDTLVGSAAAVFARRGYEGASLEEIADAAGFTRGAIYKNFGGKEDLFFAVADRDFAERLRTLSERLARQASSSPPTWPRCGARRSSVAPTISRCTWRSVSMRCGTLR